VLSKRLRVRAQRKVLKKNAGSVVRRKMRRSLCHAVARIGQTPDAAHCPKAKAPVFRGDCQEAFVQGAQPPVIFFPFLTTVRRISHLGGRFSKLLRRRAKRLWSASKIRAETCSIGALQISKAPRPHRSTGTSNLGELVSAV